MSTPDDFKPELYDWNMLTNAPKENNWIKDAWHILTMAMITDPSWAWSVHCNLAMPIMDTLNCSHIEANNAAAILMKHIFNYDVTQLKVFKDICQPSESEEKLVPADINPWLLNDKLMAAWSSQLDQLKPRKSISDQFDPDYAKFGIRNKDEFIKRTPTITNRGMSFQMKVKEYFIENAYYSNNKYPWVLFMIGESLNNDSTLFKTIKVGNLGDMERTLIIPNDELNFDDFKFVWNPANEAIEETSATCDATDFLSNLTNRIKEHRSIGSEPCDKDCIVKGIEVNPIAAHREKLLSFFKHGMTYLKKQRDNFHYVYCDDLSSYKRFVFRCESPDIRDGAFITFDLEDLDPSDWQHIDDVTIEESNKLQPIETTMKPITSRIEQLNPETKESLFNILKIRNFFKPNGVYRNKCCANDSRHIYKSHQPHFDKLAFNRVSKHDNGEVLFDIYNVELNDWVFLGIDEPIDPKVQLCQKVKAFFKPGRIYRNTKAHPGNYFTFEECDVSIFNAIACRRYDRMGKCDDLFLKVKGIKFEDWAYVGDIRSLMIPRFSSTDFLPKTVVNKEIRDFFKPNRFYYCTRPCCNGLYFTFDENKKVDSAMIAGTQYDLLGNSRECYLMLDHIDLNDWTDITDKMPISTENFSSPHYEIKVTDASVCSLPTAEELKSQLSFIQLKRSPIKVPFRGRSVEFVDKASNAPQFDCTEFLPKPFRNRLIKNFFKPGQFYYCHLPEFDGMCFSFDAIQPDSNVLIGMIYDFAGDHKLCEFSIDKININDWALKSIY